MGSTLGSGMTTDWVARAWVASARELLERAYAAVAADKLSITDEVSAVEHLGEKVVLIPNDEWNVKITYPRDLLLAQASMARRGS